MTKPETKPIRISVSQTQNVDRCKRKYWYEYGPPKRKSPSTPSQALGTAVHAVLEDYQQDGTPIPETRAGRIASAGLKHLRDAETLEIEKNILIPIGDEGARILCRIDMLGAAEPYVGDHKTTKDFKWCKSVYEVKNDVQLLTYAYAAYFESKPAEVEVELVYYRTVGLPLSMAVSAIVPWSRIEKNWHEVESKISGMVEIRANETGEGIQGNSAACGDYGGCFHADVCPYSPKALDKVIKTDNNKNEAPPHTAKTQNSKGDTVNKNQKNLQKALGLSRILPKGAPPQEEQTPALIKDAAARLKNAVEIGPINKRAAVEFLIRLGIKEETLDDVLYEAYLDCDANDMIDVRTAAPKKAPAPKKAAAYDPKPIASHEVTLDGERVTFTEVEPPTPEQLKKIMVAPFEKVDTKTLQALALELSEKYGDGVSETDALAYCDARIPENKSISPRRWARIVEFSDLTLDGGWLYAENREGYTEHPKAHDGERAPKPPEWYDRPTGAELDRAEYEKKTGKKAPFADHKTEGRTPEMKQAREKQIETYKAQASGETTPDREGYTFTEGLTKAEGMVTTGLIDAEPYVAVFLGDGDTPIMIPAEALMSSMSATVEGCGDLISEISSLQKALEVLPEPEGLTVLVDCLFESTPEGAVTLSDWLAPFRTLVEKQNRKSYYELDEMGKGRKMVAGKVLAAVHESPPTGVLLVDSRETGAGDILAILRRVEGVSIVRAIR